MNIQTVTHKGISLINVTNPGPFEIKYLKNNFGFSPLHLEDHLNRTEVPKIETFKDYILVVLDFPTYNTKGLQTAEKEIRKISKIPIKTLLNISQNTLSYLPLLQTPSKGKQRRIFSTHVDLFIGKDYVVIVHDGVLLQINEMFTLCQQTLRNREEFLGRGVVFLAYRIIDILVDSCFPVMNEITSMIDKIDRELERRGSPSTLEDISITRRNIVVFHTMVKTLLPLFRQLEAGTHKELNGPMQSFWSNILDHLEKIWDRLEDSRELIEGISESNEFLLRSKSNEIVKVLTIFSAIILPLNLIASLYGMNLINLPFSEDPYFFQILIGAMLLITLAMIFIFKLRRWI